MFVDCFALPGRRRNGREGEQGSEQGSEEAVSFVVGGGGGGVF